MRCPNCNEIVSDDVPFCPICGQNLSYERNRRKLRFILMDVQDDRRFRHLASAVIIGIVTLAVLSVLLTAVGNTGSTDHPTPTGPSESALHLPDSEDYIEFYDGFSDPGFIAEWIVDDRGKINLHITLSSKISGSYNEFAWIIRNDVTGNIQISTNKDVAEITWMNPSIGIYSLSVTCSSENRETYTHSGVMQYFGNCLRTDSFEYNGRTYSVNADVKLSEYLDLSSKTVSRSSDDAASFIIATESVHLLANRLSDAFLRNNPDLGTDGPDFASFVTRYVQSCYTEVSDMMSHSTSEYWAYPGETIYYGQGDSDDLSVLTASLLDSTGYHTGLVLMHGRTFVAVSIDFTASDVPSGMHSISLRYDNREYIICESCDEVPFGCIYNAFDYRSGVCYYYGTPTPDCKGFVPA